MSRSMNIDEIGEYVKILIYGEPGIGKTTLVATCPNLFLISCDNRLLTLRNHNLKDIINQDIKVQQVKNFFEMNEVYEFLYTHCILRDKLKFYENQNDEKKVEALKDAIWKLQNEKDKKNESRDGKYPKLFYTLSIDSLTELQRLNIDRIINLKDKKEEKIQEEVAKIDFETRTPSQNEYGISTDQMKKLCRHFKDLPMNVIFTALLRKEKDETTGEMFISPSMTGKLSGVVCSYMDIVGYYAPHSKNMDGNISRVLQVQPTKGRLAKDGSGKLGNGMINPLMPEIMKKIME